MLGQAPPAPTTNTTLYTVPAGTQAIISTISVCNLTQGELLFRIAIRPGGATLANQHYIAYNAKVAGQDTTFITVGATLSAGDVITVYESAADIVFSAFGSEIN